MFIFSNILIFCSLYTDIQLTYSFKINRKIVQNSYRIKSTNLTPISESAPFSKRSEFSRSLSQLLKTCVSIVIVPVALQSRCNAAETVVDFKRVRNSISDLIEKSTEKGPTLVRLAWFR